MRAIAKGCPLFARRAHNETHCVPWSARAPLASPLSGAQSFERESYRGYTFERTPSGDTRTQQPPYHHGGVVVVVVHPPPPPFPEIVYLREPVRSRGKKGWRGGMVMFLFGANSSGSKKRFREGGNGRVFRANLIRRKERGERERDHQKEKVEKLKIVGSMRLVNFEDFDCYESFPR